jgi:hypothetical protein
VDLSREVDWALAVDRIPARGVCFAEELRFEAEAIGCRVDGQAEDSLSGEPGRVTGSAAEDLDARNDAAFGFDDHFGGTELVAIGAEADLPRQPTSRRRRVGALDIELLPRGDEGDAGVATDQGEISREVGVLEEAEDEVGVDASREELASVVDDRGQITGDVDDLVDDEVTAALFEGGDLGVTASILLDDEDSLHGHLELGVHRWLRSRQLGSRGRASVDMTKHRRRC